MVILMTCIVYLCTKCPSVEKFSHGSLCIFRDTGADLPGHWSSCQDHSGESSTAEHPQQEQESAQVCTSVEPHFYRSSLQLHSWTSFYSLRSSLQLLQPQTFTLASVTSGLHSSFCILRPSLQPQTFTPASAASDLHSSLRPSL